MPIEIANAQKWELIKDENYTLISGFQKYPHRFGNFEVFLEANRYFFLVACVSSQARSHWWLGCRAIIRSEIADVAGFSNQLSDIFSQNCGLGQVTLVEVPNFVKLPTQLILSIPYWHKQLSIKVWSYKASELESQNGGTIFFVSLERGLYRPHPTEPDLILSILYASSELKNHSFVVIGFYEIATQNEISRPVINRTGIDSIECIFESKEPIENGAIKAAIAIA